MRPILEFGILGKETKILSLLAIRTSSDSFLRTGNHVFFEILSNLLSSTTEGCLVSNRAVFAFFSISDRREPQIPGTVDSEGVALSAANVTQAPLILMAMVIFLCRMVGLGESKKLNFKQQQQQQQGTVCT
mmetsp:Transcript_27332/g.74776  ORF Transcript_27332/g.74776 Transcript_27332/m.74776 type:complete len:131 (+) Transcript_27332:135-527(+)